MAEGGCKCRRLSNALPNLRLAWLDCGRHTPQILKPRIIPEKTPVAQPPIMAGLEFPHQIQSVVDVALDFFVEQIP